MAAFPNHFDALSAGPWKNTFCALRHGESEANVLKIISCRPDEVVISTLSVFWAREKVPRWVFEGPVTLTSGPPVQTSGFLHGLSPHGKQQAQSKAEELLKLLPGFPRDTIKIVSSDFRRTRETAEYLREGLGLKVRFLFFSPSRGACGGRALWARGLSRCSRQRKCSPSFHRGGALLRIYRRAFSRSCWSHFARSPFACLRSCESAPLETSIFRAVLTTTPFGKQMPSVPVASVKKVWRVWNQC